MCTFHCTGTLQSHVFAVSSILLSKGKESLNGLLVLKTVSLCILIIIRGTYSLSDSESQQSSSSSGRWSGLDAPLASCSSSSFGFYPKFLWPCLYAHRGCWQRQCSGGYPGQQLYLLGDPCRNQYPVVGSRLQELQRQQGCEILMGERSG